MTLSTHHKRIGTALVLIGIIAAVLMQGGLFLQIAIACLAAVGIYEFYCMFWPGKEQLSLKILGVISSCAVIGACSVENQQWLALTLVFAFWAGNMHYLFSYSKSPEKSSYTTTLVYAAGLLYVPLVLQFFLQISPLACAMVIFASAVSDTAAYYTGSIFGKNKVWPQISPKKTIEGCTGGLVACIGFFTAMGMTFGEAPIWFWIAAAVCMNIASQFGDFFESALKRKLQIKDSGNILPGHGGILDRIDSLLFALPVYAFGRMLYPLFG
ncbi:MAG: phosphatidate cytidylyltransferase [Desulfovibrio sp.]